MPLATEPIAEFLAGFVAAEGTFGVSSTSRRFRFAVSLGATDATTCYLFRDFFGCGNVFSSRRRKPHYDDECAFAVQSLLDHVEVTIPFMDAHLPASYKRTQYLRWREQLLNYWGHDARWVRPCTVDGCDRPRRAHGLCRHHLDAARGV